MPLTNKLMKKEAMMARIEVVHRLSNMDFHSSRPTWLQPLLRAQSSSSRELHWVLHMTPVPMVISQLPGGGLITLDCLHFKRGSILLLLEKILNSVYKVALPAHDTSAKTTFHGLNRIPYPQPWYSRQHCFWSRNSFTINKVWQWAHTHGIHRSYYVPHYPTTTF